MNPHLINQLSLFLFFTCFYSNIALGQDTTTLNVYFGVNKYELSSTELAKINALITTIPIANITQVELFGHTDSRQDVTHNQVLSEHRVQTVKTVLVNLGIRAEKIHTIALGEQQPIATNDTDLGRQQNRRTELVIYIKRIKPLIVQKEEPINSIPKEQTGYLLEKPIDCTIDTIIKMPNGALVKMNQCDYLKIKDCFSFQEYLNPDSARIAGLATMASDGDPLFSAGMFKVDLCDHSVCLKTLVPIIKDECSENPCRMGSWVMDRMGAWESIRPQLEIVKMNNQYYYQLEVCKSGTYNLDCKFPDYKRFFSRIKVEKGYHLVEAKLSYADPFTIVPGEPMRINQRKEKPVRKLKFKLYKKFCPKCKVPQIYAKAIAPNGDTLIRSFTLAAPYHKRTAFGICRGKVVKRFLFFFKIREKAIYRKYILRRRDFDICLPYVKKEAESIGLN